MSDEEKIIEDALVLYDKGEWQKAIFLIDTCLTTHNEQIIAEANRIRAWSYYYLAIKGDEKQKKENLEKSEEHFRLSIIKMENKNGKISILNGLPLVLWILGKKEEAWKISDEAIKRFKTETSIWNTRSILARWEKDFKKAIEVCEKVYETAERVKDYRTAGHGKSNKASTYLELHNKEEALKEYLKAEQMYLKDGKSDFHLENVRKKIKELKN